jgi:hypothetical protein
MRRRSLSVGWAAVGGVVGRLVVAACAVVGLGFGVGVAPVLAEAPAGRAYELVSPPDKEGVPLDVRVTVQASPTGDEVAFGAFGAFAGGQTALFQTYYMGRRGAAGWSVDPLDPPQYNGDSQVASPTLYLSAGFESALQMSQAGLLPGAIDGGTNIYRRDNATGSRSLALAQPGGVLMYELSSVTSILTTLGKVGVSEDLSHFSFTSGLALTPDAVPGKNNVYENIGGATRLVNRLPDGSVADGEFTNGASVVQFRPATPDGRRIAFNSPTGASGAVYVRIDGSSTILISGSKRTGDDPTVPRPGSYAGMSDDGTYVYFTSQEALTDDVVPGGAGKGALYRYNTKTDRLTNLTVVSDPNETWSEVQSVMGMSHDGEVIYFQAWNALAPGSAPGALQIYRADPSGIKLVAKIDNDGIILANYRASDDLRYLAFTSDSRPTGFDNSDSSCAGPGNACSEVYVYDSVTETLSCASCVHASGGNVASSLGAQDTTVSQYVGRTMLDDGRLFFTSGEALVPRDTNGRRDAYTWKDGVVSLVSTGTSPQDSTLVEASADGRDAFFMTSQQLVGIDKDDSVDLYDARVGGGLALQNPPSADTSCQGDGCQGSAVATPALLQPGSVGLSGDGNAADVAVVKAKSVRVSAVHGLRAGGGVSVKVAVPGRGKLTLSGKNVRTLTKATIKAASYTVRVRLSSAAKRTLKQRGKLRIVVKVAFRPATGKASSTTATVTVRS